MVRLDSMQLQALHIPGSLVASGGRYGSIFDHHWYGSSLLPRVHCCTTVDQVNQCVIVDKLAGFNVFHVCCILLLNG